MKFILFLALGVFALAGCGQNNGGGTSGPTYSNYGDDPGEGSGQSISSLFQGASVSCGSADCSPSVAMLLYKTDSDDIFACTAFVVSDGVMATNDHCVRSLQIGDDCSQAIEVNFPSVGNFSSEKHLCGKLLWRSADSSNEDNKINLDVAYFSLTDRTSRPAFSINKDGLQDGQVITIYKIDPPTGFGDLSGTLVTDKCRVTQGTFMFPYLDKPDSADFVLVGDEKLGDQSCEIISGNSGSPMVDENGALKGIIHEGTYSSTHSLFSSLAFSVDSDSMENFKDFAVATGSACMPNPKNPATPIPSSCDIAKDPALQKKLGDEDRSQDKERIKAALTKAAQDWGA